MESRRVSVTYWREGRSKAISTEYFDLGKLPDCPQGVRPVLACQLFVEDPAQRGCVRWLCYIYLFSTLKFFKRRALEELYPGNHTLFGNVEALLGRLRIPDREPPQ